MEESKVHTKSKVLIIIINSFFPQKKDKYNKNKNEKFSESINALIKMYYKKLYSEEDSLNVINFI